MKIKLTKSQWKMLSWLNQQFCDVWVVPEQKNICFCEVLVDNELAERMYCNQVISFRITYEGRLTLMLKEQLVGP